jgi:CubicO group peptidase (beta-lactamase class C family)
MQLRQGGQTIVHVQQGWARRPENGSVPWSDARRMHVASVSKLITAMALIRLLDDKGISVDAHIAPYLPAYWRRGVNVDSITFAHLLNHRSGIEVPGNDTDYLRLMGEIHIGVPLQWVGTRYEYENTNFGLMRVLIPIINGDVDPRMFESAGVSWDAPAFVHVAWDLATQEAYRNYVQQRVFAPSGISATMGFQRRPDDALAYRFPPGNGWQSNDLGSVSGGAGWMMTIDELLDVMGEFRRGGGIVSATRAQQVLDAAFGTDRVQGAPAGVFVKNGRWRNDGRMEQSVAVFLPNDMELAVFVNSAISPANVALRGLVLDLFGLFYR